MQVRAKNKLLLLCHLNSLNLLHTKCMGAIYILSYLYIHVIVIPWARVLCLIYTHKGECVYIGQSTSARAITNMFYFSM